MESAMNDEFLRALFDVLEIGRIMQASLIAMISILVFDHILTFSLEVERVWRTQETLFKVFWAALRYVPLVGYSLALLLAADPELGASKEVGVRVAVAAAILSTIGYIVAHIAFIIRVYALYARSRLVLWVLVPLLLGESALSFSVVARSVPLFGAPPPPGPPSIRQIPERKMAIIIWSYQAMFDCVVFLLTLYKSTEYRKTKVNNRLVDRILLDGSAYFVVMVALYLICIFFEAFGTQRVRGANSAIASILPLILGQRVVLNLRGLSAQSQTNHSHDQTSQTEDGNTGYSNLTQPPLDIELDTMPESRHTFVMKWNFPSRRTMQSTTEDADIGIPSLRADVEPA